LTNSPRTTRAQILGLAGWLLLTFAAAALGAFASRDAATFYAQLAKPEWAPPASVFGPVWSVLYLLMAFAAWLVWRQGRGHATAVTVFCVQLAANALWSWLFFGWHLGALAAIEVLVLLALIVATLVAFWRVRRLAAVLMLPYLAWVTFASALTWTLWRANPGLL
jgi:tryptophan-rich sensory protein